MVLCTTVYSQRLSVRQKSFWCCIRPSPVCSKVKPLLGAGRSSVIWSLPAYRLDPTHTVGIVSESRAYLAYINTIFSSGPGVTWGPGPFAGSLLLGTAPYLSSINQSKRPVFKSQQPAVARLATLCVARCAPAGCWLLKQKSGGCQWGSTKLSVRSKLGKPCSTLATWGRLRQPLISCFMQSKP